MWHPTFAVTRTFREYVLLAPQQCTKTGWLRVARRHPIPVRILAPHIVASRVSQYVLAGQTVHSSRLLLFKAITAILACVGRHSTSAVAVLLLYCGSLSAVRFLAVRYTAWCYSWRLAASAVSLVLLVMRSPLRPCCSHCWTVLFCHSVVSLWVRHGLTVPLSRSLCSSCDLGGLSFLSVFFFPGCSAWWTVLFFVSWSSSRLRFGRLSGCCCPRLAALSHHRCWLC